MLAYLAFVQGPSDWLITLYASSPIFVALLVSYFDKGRPIIKLGWRPEFKMWIKIMLYLLSVTAVLLIIAFFMNHIDPQEKYLKKFFRLSTLSALAIGILINTGEEAGWRGYLLPKCLERYGWWKTIALTAFIWWLWHVPFMAAMQIHQFGSVQLHTQITQLLIIIPFTIIFSHWYLQCQSIWALGFAHQLVNFVNKWFLGMEHSAKTPILFPSRDYIHIYSLENGLIGLSALILFAVIIHTRHRRKAYVVNPQ